MRILIVTSFFPPLNSIASHRPYSWAKYWSQAGHDVTVLTPQKVRDPQTDLEADLTGFTTIEAPLFPWIRNLKQSLRHAQGAGTFSLPTKSLACKSFFKKALGFVRERYGVLDSTHMPDVSDLWVSPALAALSGHKAWDIVISTAPPFSIHRLACRIKKKGLAKRWIMDYRDLIVGSPVTKGLFPFTALERWLERRYINFADAVTTVSDGLANSLQERYPRARVNVVANGYEPRDIEALSNEPAYPDDQLFRMVYLGNIYSKKRDPKPLFQAICQISQDPFYSLLLSKLQVWFYGPEMGDVPSLIREFKVEQWVKLGGAVRRTDALRIQRDANALLFLSWSDPEVDGIVTGKLFEYLAAGTPVVAIGAPRAGVAEKLILEADAGQDLGRNVAAIKTYLIENLQNPRKDTCLVRKDVLLSYTRECLADKMLDVISASTMRSAALPLP